MDNNGDMRTYRVNQTLTNVNIVGGVIRPGRIITRADLVSFSDEVFNHLLNDKWFEEVIDNGKIQKK